MATQTALSDLARDLGLKLSIRTHQDGDVVVELKRRKGDKKTIYRRGKKEEVFEFFMGVLTLLETYPDVLTIFRGEL